MVGARQGLGGHPHPHLDIYIYIYVYIYITLSLLHILEVADASPSRVRGVRRRTLSLQGDADRRGSVEDDRFHGRRPERGAEARHQPEEEW